MNEDQVKGSIHALQWVLRTLNPNKHDREKLYRELDGLEYRLKEMRKELPGPSRKDRVQNVKPDEPTEKELAERQAREQKRKELEARIADAKAAEICTGLVNSMPHLEQATMTVEKARETFPNLRVEPAPALPTWEYKEPAYIEEPDDRRLLPHFRGRE